MARWLAWPEILDRVALVTGLTVEACLYQRGGPDRPLALWAVRRFGGMTLREVGQMAGGMDYTAVAMAVKRFE